MTRRICKLGIGLTALLAAFALRAATPQTEPFTADLGGWTNGVAANPWRGTNQYLRLTFPGGLPQVLTATLEAGTNASAGAFSGDYSAAGVEAIGLSFFSENVKPSELKIELASGTNTVQQELGGRLSGTGAWNHFICPLIGPDASRWIGLLGVPLAQVVTNVTRVTVRVVNVASMSAQNYRLDDIFLARLPAANSLAFTGTNTALVGWTNLRTNFVYRMEIADALTNNWTALANFTATNDTLQLPHTNAVSPFFYRLLAP